jgi:hypothetical protein
MGLIYRGETRFDLKGAIPVKLPLLLTGQPNVICRVECSQAPRSWRVVGELEHFAFLSSGMVTLDSFPINLSDDRLIDLRILDTSYLRFVPKRWIVYRTNILIFEP